MSRSLKIATIVLVAAMLITPTLLQAHASESNSLYDLKGTWIWHYTFGETSQDHIMAINFFDNVTGDFSGFGFLNDDPEYNWTVTGNEFSTETGISVGFTIEYDQNSPMPYYYISAIGSINSPAYMNGTATLPTPPPGEVDFVENEEVQASWVATKISPDPNVILNFPPGSNIKSVSIAEYTSASSPYPSLPNAIGPIYNITVIMGTSPDSLTGSCLTNGFTGLVTVGIHYDPSSLGGKDPSTLVMAQFDFILGDVNHDGKVNILDLLIITKALFSTPARRNWNPNCDLNGDLRVDLRDLCLAFQNLGRTARWIDQLSNVDLANSIVYCTTDHFSGFGIH
jgi:hypothetical protein